MKSHKNSWEIIIKALTEPLVYLTTISTAYLILLSTEGHSLRENTLLAVLLALSAAVWGAKLSKLWEKLNQGHDIEKRGKQSLKTLSQLLSGVQRLQTRIEEIYSRHAHLPLSSEAITIHLEEFSSLCQFLREQGVNMAGIWEDIFPEANYEEQLQEIVDLYSLTNRASTEVRMLSEELDQAKKAKIGMDTREKLSKARDKEIKELKKLENALQSKITAFDHSLSRVLFAHCNQNARGSILEALDKDLLQRFSGGEGPWTRIIELGGDEDGAHTDSGSFPVAEVETNGHQG